MPTYQSQSNAVIAYKVQSGIGVQATGSGGTVLRVAGGSGGQLTKASTESNEIRSDGMRTRGRHGIYKTTGQWMSELSLGSHEAIMEAIVRDTWSAANLTITEATGSLASITTTANTIVNGGGSWITAGLAVYDVIRLTGHITTANNGRNLRIIGLTASTITVAETLTLNATPDTAFTITRPGKKLVQSGTLVKRYYTIDEYDADIDLSEVLTDFVFGSFKITMAPNGLIQFDMGGTGTGQFATQATGTSPLLTTPTLSTGVPFSVVDATLRVGANDMVDLTAFDLTVDIGPNTPDVFGSGSVKYAPDVFTGQMGIGLNFTCLRKDLTFMSDFLAETVYSLQVLAVDNTAEPKNFVSFVIPNLTLGGVAKSALAKAGGPRTQSVSVPVALVGRDNTGSGYDATMLKIQSTAP